MESCVRCKAAIVQPEGSIGTGAATLNTGETVCYTCADASERENLKSARKLVAYLSSNGRAIQTWSGGHLADVIRASEHRVGFGCSRRTFWQARDVHGNRWHGQAAFPGHVTTMIRISKKKGN